LLYQEFLEAKKHALTHQIMEALKVRRALIPIINDISPAAVTATADVNQRNFATLINAMTEMKMPGKAKALLHQAATIAINSFSDDDPRQASGAAASSSQAQQPQPRPVAVKAEASGTITPTKSNEFKMSTSPASQTEPATSPINVEGELSFGDYVHRVYTTSFGDGYSDLEAMPVASTSFAQYAAMDEDEGSAPSDHLTDVEDVEVLPYLGVVPIPISTSDEDQFPTPCMQDQPGEDGKRRRIRTKTTAPPNTPLAGGLKPPPPGGFTGSEANGPEAVSTAKALRAATAARLATPAVKAGTSRVKATAAKKNNNNQKAQQKSGRRK